MKTILSVVGARPQFIKHAPLQAELQRRFRALTLHTGQHYDANMSEVFFEELGIPEPDFHLQAGSGKTQAEQTAIMMTGIESICERLRPDAVLVYGDTNSTLAAALMAAKMCIPLIHVEAGLRGYNRSMPEEVNRVVADTLSQLLFCPSRTAVDNLRKEGIAHKGVILSGDVMRDMVMLARPRIRTMLEGPYYFSTIHRPYNTDEPERMRRILATLDQLPHPVILPVHPRTLSRLQGAGIMLGSYGNIRAISPVGYIESVSYQAGAECVITDSGGMQKEAYFLQRKCITLRSETEWPETLEQGWNTLVFDDIESIPLRVAEAPGGYDPELYGDGFAAKHIAEAIESWIESRQPLVLA